MTVEWKEPPPDGRSNGQPITDWGAVAGELRQHPGRWAIVLRDVSASTGYTTAHRVRSGAMKACPAGEFEARFVAPRGSGGKAPGDVYVRFVGDAS